MVLKLSWKKMHNSSNTGVKMRWENCSMWSLSSHLPGPFQSHAFSLHKHLGEKSKSSGGPWKYYVMGQHWLGNEKTLRSQQNLASACQISSLNFPPYHTEIDFFFNHIRRNDDYLSVHILLTPSTHGTLSVCGESPWPNISQAPLRPLLDFVLHAHAQLVQPGWPRLGKIPLFFTQSVVLEPRFAFFKQSRIFIPMTIIWLQLSAM